MPALLAPTGDDEVFIPLAQLGAGPDGVAVLARRGERLVELHQIMYGPSSSRWARLDQRIRAIAGFERPGPGVEAALALQAAVDADPVTTGLRCKISVHRGPMMALTQAGRLDYFGQNVELALSLAAVTPPAVVAVTQAVCQDVAVAERLHTTPDQLGMQPLAGGSWVLQISSRRGNARVLPAVVVSSAATLVQ